MQTPERQFLELTAEHIEPVLEIIDAHNPEDAEVAEESLGAYPGEDFVAWVDGQVAGVTGARPVEGSDGAYWLSWTYVHTGFRRQGIGQWMLEQLVALLREGDGRKLFVQVSDQVIDGQGIYRDALRFYRRFGFTDEAHNRDFYARGESLQILGMLLTAPGIRRPDLDRRGGRFTALFELPESYGAMGLDWRFVRVAASKPGAAKPFLAQARRKSQRVVFASAPSNAPKICRMLRDSGFVEEGRLGDFYGVGIDEIRFRYDL